MTQRQLPHFERHVREMRRTRRRFGLALAGLSALFCMAVGLQVAGAHAAGGYMISGRVYNSSTGVGLANVKVYVCNFGTAVTSSTGNFTVSGLNYRANYCVRYVGGAPNDVTGPTAVNNNAVVGTRSGYEAQVARADCSRGPGCAQDQRAWDRQADSGFDFGFENVPGQRTAGAVQPAPPVRTVAVVAPGGVLDATSGAPTTPTDFQATVSGNNAVVTLNWTDSTGGNGAVIYKLERSLDQSSWTVVAGNLGGPPYDDKSVDFGVHYYYRLSAVDRTGGASGYATSDATTSAYGSNTANDTTNTYTSDDSLVTVTVPAGALPTDADCSVTSVNLPAAAKKPGTQSQPLVVGPYQLLCKTLGGDSISSYAKPLGWSVNLKGKLKNLVNPVPQTYDADAHTAPIDGSKFDGASQILTFQSVTNDEVLVLASVPQGVSPNLVAAVLVVIVIMIGVFMLVLRKKQKDTYNEYIRHKYYNL